MSLYKCLLSRTRLTLYPIWNTCWMDNEVIHYMLLVYSVIELLSLFSRKVAHGHRWDTLAALPVGDRVLADGIFDTKLHKPRSCGCLRTLPAGCPCYLPAQAKNDAGTPVSSPQNRNLCVPRLDGSAPSPGGLQSRVLFCQSVWKVFFQSAMPLKLSPAPCLDLI